MCETITHHRGVSTAGDTNVLVAENKIVLFLNYMSETSTHQRGVSTSRNTNGDLSNFFLSSFRSV
jgi:hypothetical protein